MNENPSYSGLSNAYVSHSRVACFAAEQHVVAVVGGCCSHPGQRRVQRTSHPVAKDGGAGSFADYRRAGHRHALVCVHRDVISVLSVLVFNEETRMTIGGFGEGSLPLGMHTPGWFGWEGMGKQLSCALFCS